MPVTVVIEGDVEVPLDIASLEDFRRWCASERFPTRGRIDFVGQRIEVDMTPEDFFAHGTVKAEIVRGLAQRIRDRDLGHIVTDSSRVTCPAAELSAEPDIVFVSHASLDSGRARLVPTARGGSDRYGEIEGAVDLVVEIVSDASVTKDRVRLRAAYDAAGVEEYWIVDARREALAFDILRRGASGYEVVTADSDGFRASIVLGASYRLDRERDARGHWRYDLRERGV